MEDIIKVRIKDMKEINAGLKEHEFDIAGKDLGLLIYTDNYDTYKENKNLIDINMRKDYLCELNKMKEYLVNKYPTFMDSLPEEYKEIKE